jgi:hypothetical protein
VSETVDRSCPNDCFSLEVSGGHAARDDRAFLKDVVIRDAPGPCPNCGANGGT